MMMANSIRDTASSLLFSTIVNRSLWIHGERLLTSHQVLASGRKKGQNKAMSLSHGLGFRKGLAKINLFSLEACFLLHPPSPQHIHFLLKIYSPLIQYILTTSSFLFPSPGSPFSTPSTITSDSFQDCVTTRACLTLYYTDEFDHNLWTRVTQ